EFQPGYVSRVFRKPYKLHDKVIRPGQVIVAKEPVSN
ncbi:MAG: nucleotide exchange factor GrpE, partial [Pseudobdellovibrionaceae bacterium]